MTLRNQLLFVALLIFSVYSRGGVDVSSGYTDYHFSCFSQNGASFAVVRAYEPYGGINSNAVQNLKTARNRGFSTDISMSHCPAKNPSTQVTEMLNAIPDSLFDKVWIRVETNTSPGCSWGSNTPDRNCQYLRSLISAVQSRGKDVGIYSSTIFWREAFQSISACPDVASYPLWYLADDGQSNFSNFGAFGGWVTPSQKTFSRDFSMCGTSVNLDYRP